MNKTKIALISLRMLVLISLIYIGIIQFNNYGQEVYKNGFNDGIAYRNLKIVEDISTTGSTTLSIDYNNQIKYLILIPKNG